MSKTVCFITRNFGKYDPDSLKGYESIGGFRALRKALTMEGCDIADVLAANGVQGRGGAAYDMGKSGGRPGRYPAPTSAWCATPTRASRAPSRIGSCSPTTPSNCWRA